MGTLKNTFLMAILFLTACGSEIKPRIAPENNVTGFKIPATALSDINESSFTLPEISTKPRILIFAAELCSVCQAEHRNLRDVMASQTNVLPSNVEIYTIMVGAIDRLDSDGFKVATGIQWDPYFQDGDDLRNQLCGRGTANPCVVVELPGRGVVLKRNGEVSATELQSLTGVWTW